MKFLQLLLIILCWGGSILAFALAPSALGWSDAPDAPISRHLGDWMILAGWETNPDMPSEYELGDLKTFPPAVQAFPNRDYQYRLLYQSDHANFWFDSTFTIDPQALRDAVHYVEDVAIPLLRDEFQLEVSAGFRLEIVHEEVIGFGVQGMFRFDEQCPPWACQEMTGDKILYMSLETGFGSAKYEMTLLHELQHAFLFQKDGNERRWLNEGVSMLATHWAGFEDTLIVADNPLFYLRQPNLPLEVWSDNGIDANRYYGASYLLLTYLDDRFGKKFIQALVAAPEDGLAALDKTLGQFSPATSLEQVLADWHLANWAAFPDAITPQVIMESSGGSVTVEGDLHQYAPDFYDLPTGTYNIHFQGDYNNPLGEALPVLESPVWWSYNAELSATHLTRQLDLTHLTNATLQFQLWYDLELDYDWANVMISEDAGQTWQALQTDSMWPPSQNIPIPHYTGRAEGVWHEDQIDLSSYAGQQVTIRFEVVTDYSNTRVGLFLTNLWISELDSGPDNSQWQPEGFLYSPMTVLQGWKLAIIPLQNPTQVTWIEVIDGDATFTIANSESILMVMPFAAFTRQTAWYRMEVHPAND